MGVVIFIKEVDFINNRNKLNRATILIVVIFVSIFVLCNLSLSFSVSIVVASLFTLPVSVVIFLFKTLKKQHNLTYLIIAIFLLIIPILSSTLSPTSDTYDTVYITEYTTENTTSAIINENTTDKTVYIGKSGTKYHKQGCYALRGNVTAIAISKAQAQGKTACKICKP